MIPSLAFIGEAGLDVRDHYDVAHGLAAMEATAKLGTQIGDLIHELQRERGMSSLFLSSKGQTYGSELQVQRQATDARLALYSHSIDASIAGYAGSQTEERIRKANVALVGLSAIRDRVSSQQTTARDAISFYSATIADLLAEVESMAAGTTNADLERKIGAYLNLLNLKEKAGQERAAGAAGFAAGKFPPELFQRYLELASAQRTYEQIILLSLDSSERQLFQSAMADSSTVDVERYRQGAFDAFAGTAPLSLEATEWFRLSTKRIDRLKAVEDSLATDLLRQSTTLRQSAEWESLKQLLAILSVVILVGLFGIVLTSSIVAPLAALTTMMRRLADGDRAIETPALGQRDELGAMAEAAQFFKERLIAADLQSRETSASHARQKEQIIEQDRIVAAFDAEITQFLTHLAAAADHLQNMAEALTSAAANTNQRTLVVASATEQASTNVKMVASSAEELAASIGEIGRQVRQSSEISENAMKEAHRAEGRVAELAQSAQKIGAVVQLINLVASQTNLLALNATIEAARAGEAGKGFPVVATEVKILASQTANATEEISQQVLAIQSQTEDVVTVIQSIVAVIGQVHEISVGILDAVTQQSTATGEIARNVEQAAAGTAEVSSNVAGVQQSAAETGIAAQQVLQASDGLTRESSELRKSVRTFLGNIRPA
ncbi:nitrate- and nitrite sensing domain-containing protein [Telmatospirillum sp.]|uniref:methyl-accepting chemotaxis protein n=1 Tax=Telmatospirillum sp. TaxID=2079197 RepID=UPI00283D18AF|nr:nitrate- and nitrite sensing domain-containing protein [Telmatospirillum sp.]MDR3435198.1 nitrate- and nitrite sensing domain-containing protein [Telmatospirillum sp.]